MISSHNYQPTRERREVIGFPGPFGEEADSLPLKQSNRPLGTGAGTHLQDLPHTWSEGYLVLSGGHHEEAQDGVRVCLMIQEWGRNPSICTKQDLPRHKLSAYCVPSIAWAADAIKKPS